MEKFNLRKLSELRQKYQNKISNRFAALGNVTART
jgi:hypothetical protein